MSRHHSHLNTAVSILKTYHGNQPFAHELKQFFKGQKKYGSKDRRQIRHLCYSYFRAVNVLPESLSLNEKVIHGYFLSSINPTPFMESIQPEWHEKEALSIAEKFVFLYLNPNGVFPSIETIDPRIFSENFAWSHFSQPKLFIRIRNNNESLVKNKLDKANIAFEEMSSSTLSLKNTTQIENIVSLNREVVIQDYSSQRVASFLEKFKEIQPQDTSPQVWDCCAASGGKSILAVDTLGKIQLTQSDVRDSILRNLKSRMKQAQIHPKRTLSLDLTKASAIANLPDFDLVIADVPCSGSGTWGRTPERLVFFQENEIEQYAQLQKQITSNVAKKIKKGGCLLYITCSVYQQENSEVVEKMCTEDNLQLLDEQLINGYENGADSMFMALLKKA